MTAKAVCCRQVSLIRKHAVNPPVIRQQFGNAAGRMRGQPLEYVLQVRVSVMGATTASSGSSAAFRPTLMRWAPPLAVAPRPLTWWFAPRAAGAFLSAYAGTRSKNRPSCVNSGLG